MTKLKTVFKTYYGHLLERSPHATALTTLEHRLWITLNYYLTV